MTLSSTAERPLFFSGGANSASSAAKSSRSGSLITSLLLEAHECRSPLGKMPFPWVLRGGGRATAALTLELKRPLGDHDGFFRRDGCALGRDDRRHLLQAVR